ncbi:MAG: UDP-3-O-(3-hydroxymyristoyl)glucosamine N-acyltransferase [candidate division Zixibacteria bacterium]|nr:UDP-3-O-(3-hydroxymyristoyl)glucosamine N-acyltransferase [candidate division Zixibacteria bacterium]
MKISLAEIAQLVKGELKGEGKTIIQGVAGLENATAGQLSFIASPKYRPQLNSTRASAVIVPGTLANDLKIPYIVHSNPYYAFAVAVKMFHPEKAQYPPGIDPNAVIATDARIGNDVYIGPFCVIESQAEIGDGCSVLPFGFIGRNSRLREKVYLYPQVTICHNCTVGSNVIIHSGAVIGSDGFGFATEKGKHTKIPQIGEVIIEDNVEIGSNCTIDRGTLGATRIGRGTKLDNLVHLGHNVEIGEDCIIVAQVGISGSTKVGHHVTLAGQAGIAGHITIGDQATVAAQSGVTKSVPPKATISGYPAREHTRAKKIEVHVGHLPEYVEKIKQLEKELANLKKRLKLIMS